MPIASRHPWMQTARRAALALACAGASQAALPQHVCRPVPDSFQIDGVLDEPAWKGLDTLELVMNNNPAGGAATAKTQVLVGWSKTRLYAAFLIKSRNVKGVITQHDGALYNEDVVEMFLDPDGDSKNYLELEWNCLNTSLDYFFAGVRSGENDGWTATGMQNAVKVAGTANNASDVDSGWTLEMSLPWSAIKEWSLSGLPPKAGDKLPINFYRIDHPNAGTENLMAWSPTGAADFHRPDKFGSLLFSDQSVMDVHGFAIRQRSGSLPGPTRMGLLPWATPAFILPGDGNARAADGRYLLLENR